MDVTDLPGVNATLNSISALFLMTGYACIRRGRVALHRACMVTACTTSSLFLVSYLIYHANVGSVAFTGQGGVRVVYFTVLISHVVLAVLIVPMAVMTLSRALRRQFERHAALARWTLPVWIYVSVTGVVVYWMLYRMGQ